MPIEPDARAKWYAFTASFAPFLVIIAILECHPFSPRTPFFVVFSLSIAASVAIGAAGLVALLRQRRWAPLAWGVATLAYCLAMAFAVMVFSFFFMITFMGKGI